MRMSSKRLQRRKRHMNHSHDPALEDYPHGRGYGHDYMRGGEVFGGYGYAEREEYEKTRGEITGEHKTAEPNRKDGARR
jgi:hypothetical protein